MSHRAIPLSLSDVRRCPRGPRCEACGAEPAMGREGGTLVVTRRVPLPPVDRVPTSGVACFSLCRRCAASGLAPNITVATGQRVVAAHLVHLAAVEQRGAE